MLFNVHISYGSVGCTHRYIEVNNAAALDFETVPGRQFVLSCTASDGLGGVTSFTVTVVLRNVNESPVPTLASYVAMPPP